VRLDATADRDHLANGELQRRAAWGALVSRNDRGAPHELGAADAESPIGARERSRQRERGSPDRSPDSRRGNASSRAASAVREDLEVAVDLELGAVPNTWRAALSSSLNRCLASRLARHQRSSAHTWRCAEAVMPTLTTQSINQEVSNKGFGALPQAQRPVEVRRDRRQERDAGDLCQPAPARGRAHGRCRGASAGGHSSARTSSLVLGRASWLPRSPCARATPRSRPRRSSESSAVSRRASPGGYITGPLAVRRACGSAFLQFFNRYRGALRVPVTAQ